jgi:hypothetical protein
MGLKAGLSSEDFGTIITSRRNKLPSPLPNGDLRHANFGGHYYVLLG